MDATEVSARLEATGIVAIIRGSYSQPELQSIGTALVEGGVRVIEITLNSPDALEGIRNLRQRLPPDVLVGAGTVLAPGEVDAAIDAGTQFLIAPDLKAECVVRASRRETLFMPGVYTASEVGRAVALGCRLLKLFPASLAGPDYLRAMRGPFPEVRFVPTGGLRAEHIAPYIQAGAAALGMGSTLVGASPTHSSTIAHEARRLRDEVRRAREAISGREP